MKVIMLYRPHSEFARSAEDYMRDFKRHTGKVIEAVNVDTPEGVAKAELYGVMDYPMLVATADDGSFLKMWSGKPMPVMNELTAYAANKR